MIELTEPSEQMIADEVRDCVTTLNRALAYAARRNIGVSIHASLQPIIGAPATTPPAIHFDITSIAAHTQL